MAEIISKLEYLVEIQNENPLDSANYMPPLFFSLAKILLEKNLPELLVAKLAKLAASVAEQHVKNQPAQQEKLLETLLFSNRKHSKAFVELLPTFTPSCFLSK